MEDFLYNNDLAFETILSINSNKLDQAILEYTEFIYDNHYVTEKEHESFMHKVSMFFKKLIISLREFAIDIKTKWDTLIREKITKKKLEEIRRTLIAKQLAGERTVKSKDVEKYKEKYVHMASDLMKQLTKMQKTKYESVAEIDKDLIKFESTRKKYENELDAIADKEITISTNSAIKFFTSELSGHSTVFATIDKCINKIQEIEAEVSKIEIKRDILGAEVIPKKVGLIEKVCTKISLFFKKAISKFLAIIVFLFAW